MKKLRHREAVEVTQMVQLASGRHGNCNKECEGRDALRPLLSVPSAGSSLRVSCVPEESRSMGLCGVYCII